MERRVWHGSYDQSVPTTLDYPDIPVHQLLREAADKYPNNTTTIFHDNKLSYRQLDALVDRFASGLQKWELKKGDRVALYMPNCLQLIIAQYAVWRAGAVAVPVNPTYVAREFEQQVNDAEASFAVCLSLLSPRVEGVRPHTKWIRPHCGSKERYDPGSSRIQCLPPRNRGRAP